MPPRVDFTSPRLFVETPLQLHATIPLDSGQSNYLANVLRLPQGGRVLVFNGADGEWRARVQSSARRSVSLIVDEPIRPQPAPSRLTYAFAPLKHARLDYMVQKAVEMGVGALQPVITRRTQPTRVNRERMAANAIEAAEQCGVLAVPTVHAEMRLAAWLETWTADRLLVFCDEEAEVTDALATLVAARNDDLEAALLVGPEGGFEAAERQMLLARPRVIRLSLGPRILRADTAAVAALTLIQATLGDWR